MSRSERSRNYTMELYPDSESYDFDSILAFITSNYNYAYILHDKDTYSEDELSEDGVVVHQKGELKKPHVHIIITFKNPRSSKIIQEQIGFNIYIMSCNFYEMARYLIHLGYPDKFQYNSNEIHSNISIRIDNALKSDYDSREQDSRILLDYIFSKHNSSFITFRQLTEFAMKNDCLLELKKNTYFYKSFCDDFGFRRV